MGFARKDLPCQHGKIHPEGRVHIVDGKVCIHIHGHQRVIDMRIVLTGSTMVPFRYLSTNIAPSADAYLGSPLAACLAGMAHYEYMHPQCGRIGGSLVGSVPTGTYVNTGTHMNMVLRLEVYCPKILRKHGDFAPFLGLEDRICGKK